MKKLKAHLFRNQPATFKGTPHQWRQLVHSVCIPPSNKFEWFKSNGAGEWCKTSN